MTGERAGRLSDLLRMLEDSVDDEPPEGDVVDVSLYDRGDLDVLPPMSNAGRAWILRDRSDWERLGRYRLPWTPGQLVTALAAVDRFRYVESHRVRPVLKGAAELCGDGRATVGVLAGLQAVVRKLEDLGEEQPEAATLLPVALRALAAGTPPDLLDLGLVVDGDDWAPGARDAAREVAPDHAAPLVRLLGQLGRRRPTRSWSRATSEALTTPGGRHVHRRWVELAAAADPVPEWPDSRIGWCRGVLFVGTNADLVRAAVWATTLLQEETWPSPSLGALARRGATHNGMDGMPEALSLPVATAAVEALISRGAVADVAVLGELAEVLERKDLLRRVGAGLGGEQQVVRRIEDVRVEKGRALRRRTPVTPRKARAAMDSFLRAEVGPTLRRLGFRGGPRTWRREHPDRVDLVAVHVPSAWSGSDVLSCTYGTWFDAAHPQDEPSPTTRAGVRDYLLDVRLFSDGAAGPDPLSTTSVQRFLAELEQVAVPLLDSLGDAEVVRAVMEDRPGVLAPDHWRGPGALTSDQVLGQLALHRGDREAAVHHLTGVVDRVREPWELEGQDDVLDYWRGRLALARGLP